MESPVNLITCSAPINIAIIKYWGKSCEKLNLPLNASLSITLHQDDLKAITTAATSKSFDEDRVWLNGIEQDVKSNDRIKACLTEIRQLARNQAIHRGEDATELVKYSQKVRICSQNDFPTAAGLASSAAGYAALVAALGGLFKVEGDLSHITRRGSGSACRSVFGGFVEWLKGGEVGDGSDSVARQFLPENHWPDLCVFIVVTSRRKKSTGSTVGMRLSVETSSLLKHRVSEVVPKRLEALKTAISERDFSTFGEICMQESNQLHAICRDTYPPLQYLNTTSHRIIDLVHIFNQACGKTKLAYTFDAGPNAFLFTLQPYINKVAPLLYHTFRPDGLTCGTFMRGITLDQKDIEGQPFASFPSYRNAVDYIIFTKPGPAPRFIENRDLISCETGFPVGE